VIPSGGAQAIGLGYNLVSSAYFAVCRIPLRQGRFFTETESQAEAPLVLVSESTARRLWPGRDAIGQMVTIPPGQGQPEPFFTRVPPFPTARVIGVVADAITGMLANGSEITDLYFPTHAGIYGNDSVLVRAREERAAARRRLEAALDAISPSLSDFVTPMEDVLELQIYPFRVTAWVAAFLAGVALALTLSGIYGVMSYVVSQRTKEIGIRVALGAGRGEILRMVVRQSAWLAGVGAAAGVALALAVAPVFAHQIDAIRPYDWAPYAATAIVVFATAIGASYAPARRAVAIDPVRTLRCD
jgi:predicted lysophospholipase L1 biosynthesis ABC-type transport system permease subunit